MKKENIVKTIEAKYESMINAGYNLREINCYVNGMLKGLMMTEVITSEQALEIIEETLCKY